MVPLPLRVWAVGLVSWLNAHSVVGFPRSSWYAIVSEGADVNAIRKFIPVIRFTQIKRPVDSIGLTRGSVPSDRHCIRIANRDAVDRKFDFFSDIEKLQFKCFVNAFGEGKGDNNLPGRMRWSSMRSIIGGGRI